MKYVKIWGGLGNQLFQFGFAQYLQKQTNEPIIYINEQGYVYQDKIGLSKVFHDLYDNSTESERYFSNYFNSLYRYKRKLIQTFPRLSNSIFVESLHQPFPVFLHNYTLYDGYWQNLMFIQDARPLLVERFNTQVEPEFANLYQKILSTANSVALHVRRGDYLKSKLHITLETSYYQHAISLIEKQVNQPVFFIFSDDFNWAKKNISFSQRLIFIENDGSPNSAIRDLKLMHACNHHIIANSTFSWWAAWLNNKKNKIVIAPANWYGNPTFSASKILSKEWLLL